MKKAFVLIMILLAVFAGVVFLSKNTPLAEEKAPFIAVTNFALYDIACKITAGEVSVKKLVPFGVEMHTFMPSVKTMSELSASELFVFSGLGMEPWIKNIYPNEMDMSHFVTLKENSDHHEDENEEEAVHHHGATDPHYWLDIDNMKQMTKVLSLELQKHFPQFKQKFEANANAYIAELTDLDRAYKAALKTCKRHEIVVSHNAFGYLGQRYGFSSHSVTGLSPDEQASAKKMIEITDLVREEGIKIIFFESFVSPKVSETIAKESGVQVESLQPLANVTEAEAAKGYIVLMRENLGKLTRAMECQ